MSSPKGSAAPLPVPALLAAPGQWSGSPRTRTASGEAAWALSSAFEAQPQSYPPAQPPETHQHHLVPCTPFLLGSPQDGEVRPGTQGRQQATVPRVLWDLPSLPPLPLHLPGGFTETSAGWTQRPCSRAVVSTGASWLGPVARTRVISPSLSGR